MSFEGVMYQGAIEAVGDPTIWGMLVFGFFLGFVTMQGQRFEAKVFVLVPASILALAFMPHVVAVPLGLVMGFMLYMGIMKLINR